MNSNNLNNEPYLEMTEQPGASYYRNESEIEKEKHGCIQGVSNGKTYPTVRVVNGKGKMKIVVEPVNEDNGEPHYCRLVRQDRTSLSEKVMDKCSFHLTKKNNYTEKCKLAVMIPGKDSKFLRPNTEKNLGKIILKFELFDENENKLDEIRSEAFSNKRNKLEIKKMSQIEGSVEGGSSIWIACSRFQSKNNNIEIRFSKENWETYVKINEAPNQDLLIIDSPPYIDQNIVEPVIVDVQLKNQIDGAVSEKFSFTYQPKRQAIKRCASPIEMYDKENHANGVIVSDNILSEFLQLKRKRIDDCNIIEKNSYTNYSTPIEYNDNIDSNNNDSYINDSYNNDSYNNDSNNSYSYNNDSNNSNNNNVQNELPDNINASEINSVNIPFDDSSFDVFSDNSSPNIDSGYSDNLSFNMDFSHLSVDVSSNISSLGIHSGVSSNVNQPLEQHNLSDLNDVLEKNLPTLNWISDNNFPCGITEEFLLSENFVVPGFPCIQTEPTVTVPFDNYFNNII